ncbi:MAG: carbamoyltransferase C-terminal domain-containing protein [Thermoanaerobaculia bacterium]
MSTILGLAVNFHDSNLALVKDGTLCEVVEVERLSRVKKMRATELMSYLVPLLRRHGLAVSDLDAVATCLHGGLVTDCEWRFPSLYPQPLESVDTGVVEGTVRIGEDTVRAYAVHHHLAHGALAAFAAPFPFATVVSFDGGGDEDSFTVFDFTGERLELQQSFRINLGVLFSLSGEKLFGMERRTAAGKLMAYAALGQPREAYSRALHNVIEREESSPYERTDLWGVLSRSLGAREDEYQADSVDARDLAASIQLVFEEALLATLDNVQKRDNLCLTGGCALNCVANTRVFAHTGSMPYVSPMADDGGIAAGAAIFVSGQLWRAPPACDAIPFVGRAYAFDGSIEHQNGLRSTYVGDAFADIVAQRIAAGAIYALIDGRSECGPRALGHRSLVADPRRHDLVDFLNSAVKGREWYRPFAPAVLAGRAEELFDGPVNELMSFSSRIRHPDLLPAIAHVDGSARVQAVSGSRAPSLAAILASFEQLTGLPVLLNTSLNGPNEPICDAPDHALALLATRPIDGLVCDGWLIERV